MFTDDFNPTAALAACPCPRCKSLGLLQIDDEAYTDTPATDKHQAAYYIEPSIAARCPACGLVMEWPGCRED
jgi:phage FluMu protein Com